MVELVSGIRSAGIALARTLPGNVGVACMGPDLAHAIADEYAVTAFSIWSSLGKRFDNIVVLYEPKGGEEESTLEAARNLVTRLSGPDGKVYLVV